MQMRSLEQLMNKAIPDLWIRNPRGQVVVKRPNVFSNSGDVAVTATIVYGTDSVVESRNGFKDRREIPNPPASLWSRSMREYGLIPVALESGLSASIYHSSFHEDMAADILNSNGGVISADDIRKKFGTSIYSRDIFKIGEKVGKSEAQVTDCIKKFYTAQQASRVI